MVGIVLQASRIKGVGIGESSGSASFRAEQEQLKPIGHRAVKVHAGYYKAAKNLESKYHHTAGDENGLVKSALLSGGTVAGKHEGTALGLGIGCFEELSAGFSNVYTFIARNRAVSYVDRDDDKSPKEALVVPLKDPSRVGPFGHFQHFRLERPHLGPEPHVRLPAVARRLRHACG